MGGRASKRVRERTIRRLQEATGADPELAGAMYDRQIVPQREVARLRAQGHDVEAVFVDTGAPRADGFPVVCVGCGRRATLPFEPPAGKKLVCPDCHPSTRG